MFGGVFTYAFGRAIGLSRSAATLAGLSFAFGSFLVGQMHHKNLADAAVWLPLILCGVERGFQSAGGARARWWLFGGAAFGVQLLTIHINPILMTGMLVGAYVLFRARRPSEIVGPFGLIGGVGLGLAAIQLVPLGELAAQSFRGRAVTWQFATAFSLPPQNLLTLLFPYFYRDPGGAYWSPWFRWNTTIYAGVAPLLLASIAVALPRRPRQVWFFLGAFLVALCLAFGDRAPVDLYALLWRLPIFSSTRVPGRYLFLALFSLAMLAGLGLDALRRALAGPRTRRVGSVLHGLTAGATGIVLALPIADRWVVAQPESARAWLEALYLGLPGRNMEFKQVDDPLRSLAASLDPTSGWTGRGVAWLVLALVVLWLGWRIPRLGRGVPLALLALTVVDLLTFARDVHPRLPIEVVADRGPAAQFLVAHNGMHRVLTLRTAWETAPNRLVPLRVQEASGYSSLLPDRHQAYLAAAQTYGRLLDIMGVRYVVVRRSSPPARLPAGPPVFQDDEVDIYERASAMPRVWLTRRPVLAASPDEALAFVQRPSFEPARDVVLEGATAADLAAPAADSVGPVGQAEIVSYQSERVRVRVSADRAGYLVLADTDYPGWVARVDGIERPILRADYLFRAVAVSAGAHVLDFQYQPGSFRIGAIVSGLSLLGLAGLAVATLTDPLRLRQRRPQRSIPSSTLDPVGS